MTSAHRAATTLFVAFALSTGTTAFFGWVGFATLPGIGIPFLALSALFALLALAFILLLVGALRRLLSQRKTFRA